MEEPTFEGSQRAAPTPGPASHSLLTLQSSRTLEQQPGSRFLHLHQTGHSRTCSHLWWGRALGVVLTSPCVQRPQILPQRKHQV